MLSFAARTLARRQVATFAAARPFTTSLEQFDDYGKSVFTGAVADEYLKKHGGSAEILKDPAWVKNHADMVAMATFDW
jgi:glutamine synthetase